MNHIAKIFFTILMFSPQAFSLNKHVHGEVQLNIAFDGLAGKVELLAPAEAVVGRERAPKKKEQLEKFEADIKAVGQSVASAITFSESSKCTTSVEKSDFKAEKDGHADVLVVLKVQCEQSIRKTNVKLHLGNKFKRIKRVRAQLLVDEQQMAKDIKQKEFVWEVP